MKILDKVLRPLWWMIASCLVMLGSVILTVQDFTRFAWSIAACDAITAICVYAAFRAMWRYWR